MPTPFRPKKASGNEQNVYWIRKKVPSRFRALVGKGEVWRSLKTIDRRTANARIAARSFSAASLNAWPMPAVVADPPDTPPGGKLVSPSSNFTRSNGRPTPPARSAAMQ